MIVGWMDVDSGVVLLTWALLLAVATAAKIYDESIRTRLGAARSVTDHSSGLSTMSGGLPGTRSIFHLIVG